MVPLHLLCPDFAERSFGAAADLQAAGLFWSPGTSAFSADLYECLYLPAGSEVP